MKAGYLFVLVTLLQACGGAADEGAAPPAADTAGGESEAQVSMGAANESSTEADSAALVAQEDAEHQARCGDVTLTPGLPPTPPPAPATAAYGALQSTYEAAFAPDPPATDSLQEMEAWGQRLGEKIGALNEQVMALPEPDRGPGFVWLAHVFARLPEQMKNQPLPADLTDPVDQLAYRRGFHRASAQQVNVMLEQALAILGVAQVDGPWADYKAALEIWIVQESCDRGY